MACRRWCLGGCITVAMLLVTAEASPIKAEAPSQTLTLKDVIADCREQTGALESDFEAMMTTVKKGTTSFEAACMRACLMKKFDLMDTNGRFNREVALEIASQHVADDTEKMRVAMEIVNICYSMEVSDNHCEAAEQYGKCAADQIPVMSN